MRELTREQFDAVITMLSDCKFNESERRPRYLELLAHDDALRQRIEALEKMLEAQRTQTYRVVERECRAKKQFAQVTQERDECKAALEKARAAIYREIADEFRVLRQWIRTMQ